MNHLTAIVIWVIALVLRLAIGRRIQPSRKGFVFVYLGLNLLLSAAFWVRSYNLLPARVVHLPEWVLAWILISTIVMYLAPLRLILIPNLFVFGLIFSLISGFGLVDAGFESSNPIIELLVFGIFLSLTSILCIFRLNRWWTP